MAFYDASRVCKKVFLIDVCGLSIDEFHVVNPQYVAWRAYVGTSVAGCEL